MKNVDDREIAVAEYLDWYNHRRVPGRDVIPPAEYEDTHRRHNPAPMSVGASGGTLH